MKKTRHVECSQRHGTGPVVDICIANICAKTYVRNACDIWKAIPLLCLIRTKFRNTNELTKALVLTSFLCLTTTPLDQRMRRRSI